jgi:A/G-specific adenine glycosylase
VLGVQAEATDVLLLVARWLSPVTTQSVPDVLHAWQGLGYYSRARHLRRAAQEMLRVHDGRVPERVSELLALPGIGPYSAGAIASITYGHAEPLRLATFRTLQALAEPDEIPAPVLRPGWAFSVGMWRR